MNMNTPTTVVRTQRDLTEPLRGGEQDKLTRLFELQAVIASLRTERAQERHRDDRPASRSFPVV